MTTTHATQARPTGTSGAGAPLIAPVLLLAFVLAAPCALAQTRSYKDLEFPPLGEITLPDVHRVTLDNGMRLILVEDRELPLIEMTALIRTGAVYEPADKVGLASITGEVMRTGGAGERSGDEIDALLEGIAASVESSIGQESGSASLSVLTPDLDVALSVLADVLMRPRFDPEKIELSRIQARSQIARRNDNQSAITAREFRRLIYGPDSPHSRIMEYATLDAIDRDDLVAFHQRFYHPGAVILGVWGDFEAEAMAQKIAKAFQGWEKRDAEAPPLPPVEYEHRSGVHLVARDDVNQSHIRLGHIGGLMNAPDYGALVLMNEILGGSFGSRLMTEIRVKKGLAYSVFGVYATGYATPSLFAAGCQTGSGNTVLAIQAILGEIRRMTEEPVTEDELEQARTGYLNSFVFNFDSKGDIVNRLLTYAYYDYPEDFLQQTRAAVEKATPADILAAARRVLRPDTVQILVVGRPDDFDAPLSEIGEVREIDIAIPEPAE